MTLGNALLGLTPFAIGVAMVIWSFTIGRDVDVRLGQHEWSRHGQRAWLGLRLVGSLFICFSVYLMYEALMYGPVP